MKVNQSSCCLQMNLLTSVGCFDTDLKFITLHFPSSEGHKRRDDIVLVGHLICMELCWDH